MKVNTCLQPHETNYTFQIWNCRWRRRPSIGQRARYFEPHLIIVRSKICFHSHPHDLLQDKERPVIEPTPTQVHGAAGFVVVEPPPGCSKSEWLFLYPENAVRWAATRWFLMVLWEFLTLKCQTNAGSKITPKPRHNFSSFYRLGYTKYLTFPSCFAKTATMILLK